MRLIELDPRWLLKDGDRIGFIFKSPTNSKFWQSCFFAPTERRQQREAFRSLGLDDAQICQVQGCLPSARWAAHGPLEFDILTVTPSLDGSAGGLWHGFITNGEIVGGI